VIQLRFKNFHFNWKISLFTLLFFSLFIRLGFWQLEREKEKLDLQSLFESRLSAETQELDSLDADSDLQNVSVRMLGQYDNAHTFLLDNKINEGQAGFEVISPFLVEGGELVMVNRGWIASNAYRENLPQPEAIEGEVELSGAIYVPLGDQFMLAQDELGTGWPRIIQSLDMKRMSEALDEQRLFPYTVRLAPFSPGVYVRNWPVFTTSPERHKGYAIQWFSMASVLLLLYLYLSTRPEDNEEALRGQE
jgi:surfeit locus 1 family protein